MSCTRASAERAAIDFLTTKCFELFVEQFPNSKVGIVKLRQLMQSNGWHGREKFVQELDNAIKTRLLHVGVNTHDILKGYAAIVEGLALFDPSFVLVHKVCRKIRDYVK
ncbi:anaphase-promoting complex subunit 2 [Ditylenchus destructor]|uniref:Anaphase-promoting complex subunit 2 n=1 Tax=Ditylenchus destructor TaxID=166010 RepID=A0AAD4R717_9BILA|nr:anaphase-promoting complex subunit 2 [Ditylenchus destructor]